jgi:hypothetical protein
MIEIEKIEVCIQVRSMDRGLGPLVMCPMRELSEPLIESTFASVFQSPELDVQLKRMCRIESLMAIWVLQ